MTNPQQEDFLESLGDLGMALHETCFLASWPPDDLENSDEEHVVFYNRLQNLKALIRCHNPSKRRNTTEVAEKKYDRFDLQLQNLKKLIQSHQPCKKSEKLTEDSQEFEEFSKGLNQLRHLILHTPETKSLPDAESPMLSPTQDVHFWANLQKFKKMIEGHRRK